jgi:hypothetical protein
VKKTEGEGDNKELISTLYHRHVHEIDNYKKWVLSQKVRDTDPNCVDFSDVIKKSCLVMVSQDMENDENNKNFARLDA